jgi:CubicO group peptidase (beta-lactamase class C family)
VREFADERIFRPLGMTDTHFHDDYTHVVPNRASSYTPRGSNSFRRSFLDKFDQVGSGGVLSTVEDLAAWDENFYTGTVGGHEFLQHLHTRGVLANGDTIDYALGLSLSDYKGVETVSHSGGMMGFRTYLLRFPDERFSVICLCNAGNIDPGAIAYDIADLHLADRFSEALAAYSGSYHSAELDNDFRIRVEDGKLMAERAGQPPTELRSLGADRFEVRTGLRIQFERDETGLVSAARLNAGRANGMKYVRR